jgi:hypothetical protein
MTTLLSLNLWQSKRAARFVAAALTIALGLAACSGGATVPTSDAGPDPFKDATDDTSDDAKAPLESGVVDDGGNNQPDGQAVDAAVEGGLSDGEAGACVGSAQIDLQGPRGIQTVSFERAQFGRNKDGTLQVEMHRGGSAACPTMNSPTPDYTLSLLALDPSKREQTIRAALFEFRGDLLGGRPIVSFSVIIRSQFDAVPNDQLASGCLSSLELAPTASDAGSDAGVAVIRALRGGFATERCRSLDE